MRRGNRLLILIALLFSACGGSDEPTWEIITQGQPGALLSVWGTSSEDVWVVGADAHDGKGPLVFHYDAGSWSRLETGLDSGDLWWVFGFKDGPIYIGGTGGVILRYEGGAFTSMDTPGTGTVFGIWGSSPEDVWAVGGASESADGFAWRLQGGSWTSEPSLPADVPTTGSLWKVHGTSADNAWLVGSNGLSFYWDGETLTPGETGVGSSLFTVFGNRVDNQNHYTAVGGLGSGIVMELEDGSWIDKTPDPRPMGLSGVCTTPDGRGYAVGAYGTVLSRNGQSWQPEDLGFGLNENLHAVWLDDQGGVWAVGGLTAAPPPSDGIVLHLGPEVAELTAE
jgi:hypothetical protein